MFIEPHKEQTSRLLARAKRYQDIARMVTDQKVAEMLRNLADQYVALVEERITAAGCQHHHY
jgi:hypothetical protein